MPNKPRRPCRRAGCPALVTGDRGFCEQHSAADWREQDRRKRETRPEDKRFYDSALWRAAREQQLRASPFCKECGRMAEMVDHVVPLRHGGEPTNPSNLASLCHRCHNVKRAHERRLVPNAGATES